MIQQEGMRPIYREVQQFRQGWIWTVVVAIAGLIWVAGVRQLILNRPFGGQPMPDILLVIFWLIFGIGFPALFLFCRLVIEVRDDGIYIRFSPFHLSFRRIGFEKLKEYEVRTYRPIREYGGWGIRSGSKGKAYNVSGNRGVQLVLTNGKRVLLGSQRPEALWQAIHDGARRQ